MKFTITVARGIVLGCLVFPLPFFFLSRIATFFLPCHSPRKGIMGLVPHCVLTQMRPQAWEQVVGKVFTKTKSVSHVECKRKYVGELPVNVDVQH